MLSNRPGGTDLGPSGARQTAARESPSSVIPKVTAMRREKIRLVEIPLVDYVDSASPRPNLAQSPEISYITNRASRTMSQSTPEREPAAEQRDQGQIPYANIKRRLALRALVRRAKTLTTEQILALIRSMDRRRY